VTRLSIEEKILEILRKYRWGLTSKEISDRTGVSRITISKYLERMRADGVVDFRRIGAYKIWYVREIVEEAKKILPKKIIVAIGRSFLRVFGDDAYNIAQKVGSALVDEISDVLFVDEKINESELFPVVAELVSILSEGVRAEGIKLHGNHGLFRVLVEDGLFDPEIIKLIAYLFSGTIFSIFEKLLNKSVKVSDPIINAKDHSFEILVEVKF